MSTDPNWLPSTVAQSTAALVAIIGGFLVSRLVSLSSERVGLRHQREDLSGRRRLLELEVERLDEARLTTSRRWFREQHLAEFIDVEGVVDSEEAVANWSPVGGQDHEMIACADELAETVRRAFAAIRSSYDRAPDTDLRSLRQRFPDVEARDEWIYQGVANAVTIERGGESDPDVDLSPEFGGLMAGDRQRDTVDRLHSARAELAAAVAQIEFVQTQESRIARPPGIVAGIVILGLFAVAGVGFPMTIMSIEPVPDTVAINIALIAAFALGFSLLVGYLVWTLRSLGDSD